MSIDEVSCGTEPVRGTVPSTPTRDEPALGHGDRGHGGVQGSKTGAGAAVAALAALTAAVDALAAVSDPTVPGARLEGGVAVRVVGEALALAGRLSAIAAWVVPVVEADGWWAVDGARSITTWVAAQGRLSHGQAGRVVALGRAFRDDLPVTARDVVAGVVALEAAHAIAAAANTPVRRAALGASAPQCGEEFLVAQARSLPVAQFRVLARRWAAAADPAADERGYAQAVDREFLELSQTVEGCHLAGFLTSEHGHALAAALHALGGRSADQAGQPASRRRAGALVNLTRLVLDRDLTGATGTHRPHLTAVVDYPTLHRALDRAPGAPATPIPPAEEGGTAARDATAPEATVGDAIPADAGLPHPADDQSASGANGAALPTPRPAPTRDRAPGPVVQPDRFAVADLVGTGPIPDTVLARLACDSAITRVVFGAASQILNVGRTERTYTGPKRTAIIARDQHCQYPTCDAPPALSEIHHTHHWHRDHGTTDTHTGILLCWHHHTTVHDRSIEITRHPHGHWTFTDRHGHPLRT
ncbi:DUF222 domain-containing protein [Cellulomonas fengjieae]|uniref:DUF222 domain-containing protein n=1 Tax=Cellulomonas fengjieae TaxID=2819978 RepID=UPI001BCF9CF5|nr:DUF222 domain-containing protein [Cellulomonas fengjieae]QVI66441.1 DUF222 domain-containing protein [Cellulomonas fengjieae]